MPNLSQPGMGAGSWIFNMGAVRAISKASRGVREHNVFGSANYYNMMRKMRSKFNYFPNLNKYPYVYRGFKSRIYTPKTPTLQNRMLRRNPGYNAKNFTLKNINKRIGWSSWTLRPDVARRFGEIVLRMPTSFLKNVKVGNLSRTNEYELILPPMNINFNANTNSKMANVKNIVVNSRYVREGSNVKTFIGREGAYKFVKPRPPAPRRR